MTCLEPLIDTAIVLLAAAAFIFWLLWRREKEESWLLKQDAKMWHRAWCDTWAALQALEQEERRLQHIVNDMANKYGGVK